MNFVKIISVIFNYTFKRFPAFKYYDYRHYYYKGNYYEDQNHLKDSKDFDAFLRLIQDDSILKFKSSIRLAPLDIDFSFSENKIIALKGTPRFIIEKEHLSFFHRVLFFKTQIDGISFITQFHFVNDCLWNIKQEIAHAKIENRNKIWDLLLTKYSTDIPKNVSLDKQIKISDSHGTHMLITHNVKTEIIYFNQNPFVINLVARFVKNSIDNRIRESKFIEQKILQNL